MQNKRRERRENMKLMSNIPPPNIPISNGKKLECVHICITKTISLNILCIPQKTLPPRKDTRKMFENTRGSVAIYMMLLHTLDELDREHRFIRANLYTAIWFPE